MRPRSTVAGALLAALTATGQARDLPADCSTAAAPKQPLEVSAGGTRFTPKSVELTRAGTITSEGARFDTYRISFQSENTFSPPLEAGVTVLVAQGQAVDGKVFRRLPTKEFRKQPSPQSGLPEVQGWSFKHRPAKFDSNHVRHVGSMRLEFGRRQGNTIGGNIHLCVAKGQKGMFDKAPTQEASYAIGTFQATIK